ITVTGASAASALIVWPDGKPRPLTSNLNFVAGQTIANRVITMVSDSQGPNGAGVIDIYNQAGAVDVIVDQFGVFTDPAGTIGTRYVGLAPTRVLDTRAG